jgi:hypothetical protein
MTAPEHSPLPWIMSSGYNEFIIHQPSEKTTVKIIAAVSEFANGRLIVTAVNTRADLLAAAKAAVREFDAIMEIGAESDDCINTRNTLQAAIAAAEEPAS